MILFSLYLPKKLRLDLKLLKRRGETEEIPIIPDLEKIRKIRKGNKISRFFRHVFEHKDIKKNFGINLAILAIAMSFFPEKNPFSEIIGENSVIHTPLVIDTKTGIQYPVDKVRITQNYKYYHQGIDLDGVTGDNVKPIMAGKVEAINYSNVGYGNAILINHGSGFLSLYAHLSKILVKKDDIVTNQTVIGKIGATGRAFGDHLHLEIYENGKTINPLSVLPR